MNPDLSATIAEIVTTYRVREASRAESIYSRDFEDSQIIAREAITDSAEPCLNEPDESGQ